METTTTRPADITIARSTGVHLRIRVGGREFVQLTASSQVEVYDFPRMWGGVPRFLGYAPPQHAAMVRELADRAVQS